MTSDLSESSGSSRVRQFGLYSNIDARTEEFLRLSRKRQIRQGCACAAVSTAITVTIIVSILLVFEFKVFPKTGLQSTRNWLGLMNDTTEETQFNKAKYSIDKTTLKLLPILIKAINENKFLDKILDDKTTPSPAYERKHTSHTTEFTYKKNVFSDRNNWIRFPTSRLLAIEYKTAPIMYFKTPKNDYFTKIRKIRDYQRIMNYVDKMISDRVTFGSTQPMKRNENYISDDPQIQEIVTKPMNKLTTPKFDKGVSLIHKILSTTPKNIILKNQKHDSCKCPSKMHEILNNLLSNIQLLMPHYKTTESTIHSLPCGKQNNKLITPRKKTFYTFGSTVSNIDLTLQENQSNQRTTLLPNISPHLTFNKPESEQAKVTETKVDHKHKNIGNSLHPKNIDQRNYSLKSYLQHSATTPPMFIERTEINEEQSTEPISNQMFTEYYPSHFTVPPDNDEKNKEQDGNKISPGVHGTNIYYNESDEDENSVTTTNIADRFLNLDVHSLELVKRKIVKSHKKTKKVIIKRPYTNIKMNQFSEIPDTKWYNVYNKTSQDLGKIFYPIATLHYLYRRHNLTTNSNEENTNKSLGTVMTLKITSSSSTTSKTTTTTISTDYLHTSKPDIDKTIKAPIISDGFLFKRNKSETKSGAMDQKCKDEAISRSEELNLDDDFEKFFIEDNYQEDDLMDRQLHNNMSPSLINFSRTSLHEDNVAPKITDSNNKDTQSKFHFTSLALQNKPQSFLENQQNDFKHEENYDFNLNQLFD